MVSITESLTKMRMEAVERAREEFEFHNDWKKKKKIMYKDVNNSQIKTY